MMFLLNLENVRHAATKLESRINRTACAVNSRVHALVKCCSLLYRVGSKSAICFMGDPRWSFCTLGFNPPASLNMICLVSDVELVEDLPKLDAFFTFFLHFLIQRTKISDQLCQEWDSPLLLEFRIEYSGQNELEQREYANHRWGWSWKNGGRLQQRRSVGRSPRQQNRTGTGD